MLYLITGWTTEHREGNPTVLYCGSAADAAESAVTYAAPDFLRVERAMVIDSYKVRSGVVAGVSPAPVASVTGSFSLSGKDSGLPGGKGSEKPEFVPVVVPSLKEVMDAGYKKPVAEKIIARQQAMRDAQDKDPTLTIEALDKIGNAIQ